MDIFHQTKAKLTPKDFFLYLGMVVTLFASAGSLIKLLFDIINISFPDQLYSFDPYTAGMRFAIASLLIIFPIYLSISYYLAKQIRENNDQAELWIRKWLIYLIIFITGVILIGDLVALVNTFLGGEITTRFILKVLAVGVVFGGIFAGYVYVIRQTIPSRRVVNLFLSGSLVVVAVSLISGFLVIGSPVTARKLSFDQERVNNLQMIQWQLIDYWQAKGELPDSLSSLHDSISGFTAPLDPVTNEAYRYVRLSELSFELCADFALESQGGSDSYLKPAMPLRGVYDPVGDNWQHDAGQQCFPRTIDPDIYKR
ncbi:MAG: DUF5671 domain-containing protein [Candidatus Paceibacterota bacterium]